jgi:hypothetical protein
MQVTKKSAGLTETTGQLRVGRGPDTLLTCGFVAAGTAGSGASRHGAGGVYDLGANDGLIVASPLLASTTDGQKSLA